MCPTQPREETVLKRIAMTGHHMNHSESTENGASDPQTRHLRPEVQRRFAAHDREAAEHISQPDKAEPDSR